MQFALLSTLFLATATASAQVVRDYYLLFSWIYGVKLPYFFKKRLYKSVLKRLPQEEFSSTTLPILPLRTVLLLPSDSLESKFCIKKNFFFSLS